MKRRVVIQLPCCSGVIRIVPTVVRLDVDVQVVHRTPCTCTAAYARGLALLQLLQLLLTKLHDICTWNSAAKGHRPCRHGGVQRVMVQSDSP